MLLGWIPLNLSIWHDDNVSRRGAAHRERHQYSILHLSLYAASFVRVGRPSLLRP